MRDRTRKERKKRKASQLREEKEKDSELRFCWCDADTSATFHRGLMNPFFVVEIRVKEWKPDDPKNASLDVVSSLLSFAYTGYANLYLGVNRGRSSPKASIVPEADAGEEANLRNEGLHLGGQGSEEELG
jgi:hypothetical protein